jgi:hypothetical protein
MPQLFLIFEKESIQHKDPGYPQASPIRRLYPCQFEKKQPGLIDTSRLPNMARKISS